MKKFTTLILIFFALNSFSEDLLALYKEASLYRASKSSENEFKAKNIKIRVVNFFIVLNLDCILQYKCKIRK